MTGGIPAGIALAAASCVAVFACWIYWAGMVPVVGESTGFVTVTVADAIAWLPEASVAE